MYELCDLCVRTITLLTRSKSENEFDQTLILVLIQTCTPLTWMKIRQWRHTKRSAWLMRGFSNDLIYLLLKVRYFKLVSY